jgi:hypothetical protein
MANCFTCGEQITFDKNILSKTGKQIPLWPDKQDAHGHDKDTGKPIRQPLPNANLSPEQTQQFNQYNRDDKSWQTWNKTQQPQQYIPKSLEQQPQRFQQTPLEQKYKERQQQIGQSTSTSQGGSYLDTKRLRVLTEELAKEISTFNEKMEALYQLAKSNNAMLGELTQVFKITDPKSAAELYEVMQHTKNEALKKEPAQVHGWNSVPNTKLVDESKDFPVEETLKDDDDVDDDDHDNNTKGVIDDL